MPSFGSPEESSRLLHRSIVGGSIGGSPAERGCSPIGAEHAEPGSFANTETTTFEVNSEASPSRSPQQPGAIIGTASLGAEIAAVCRTELRAGLAAGLAAFRRDLDSIVVEAAQRGFADAKDEIVTLRESLNKDLSTLKEDFLKHRISSHSDAKEAPSSSGVAAAESLAAAAADREMAAVAAASCAAAAASCAECLPQVCAAMERLQKDQAVHLQQMSTSLTAKFDEFAAGWRQSHPPGARLSMETLASEFQSTRTLIRDVAEQSRRTVADNTQELLMQQQQICRAWQQDQLQAWGRYESKIDDVGLDRLARKVDGILAKEANVDICAWKEDMKALQQTIDGLSRSFREIFEADSDYGAAENAATAGAAAAAAAAAAAGGGLATGRSALPCSSSSTSLRLASVLKEMQEVNRSHSLSFEHFREGHVREIRLLEEALKELHKDFLKHLEEESQSQRDALLRHLQDNSQEVLSSLDRVRSLMNKAYEHATLKGMQATLQDMNSELRESHGELLKFLQALHARLSRKEGALALERLQETSLCEQTKAMAERQLHPHPQSQPEPRASSEGDAAGSVLQGRGRGHQGHGHGQCPQGHPLKMLVAMEVQHICDACGHDIDEGSRLRSCGLCGYDLCEACAEQDL